MNWIVDMFLENSKHRKNTNKYFNYSYTFQKTHNKNILGMILMNRPVSKYLQICMLILVVFKLTKIIEFPHILRVIPLGQIH